MAPLRPPISIAVESKLGVEKARIEARALARSTGLGENQIEEFVLVVSELATNLVRYAIHGELRLRILDNGPAPGVEVISVDDGPGIPDLDRALEDGYSTGGGLGSGLPAVRRLMDEFSIESSPSRTRIVARKWQSTR